MGGGQPQARRRAPALSPGAEGDKWALKGVEEQTSTEEHCLAQLTPEEAATGETGVRGWTGPLG